MRRRRLLTRFGIGVIGGLAGCAAPFGGSGAGIRDVDWLDGDELDADALAASHVSTLLDAGSFELFSTAETASDGDAEPPRWLPSQEYEARFEAARGRRYLRQEMIDTDEPEVFELYVDDREAFVREVDGEQVTVDRAGVDTSPAAFDEEMEIESSAGVRGVGGWNMTVADRAAEYAGERTVRLVADAFDGDPGIPETVSSANASMHVTAAGVVPVLQQRWEGSQFGQGATVDIDIAFSDVGETVVAEPAWTSEARE